MRTAVAALAMVGLITGCSSGSAPDHSVKTTSSHAAKPKTDIVHGTLAIKGMDGVRLTRMNQLKQGLPCSTTDGYSDITAGAQVVISDDAGHTLTIVPLGRGRFNASLQCSFPFHARVPAGKRFYGVEVSGRGVVKEPESTLGDVSLTLG